MKEASLGSVVLEVGNGAVMFGDTDTSYTLTGDYDIQDIRLYVLYKAVIGNILESMSGTSSDWQKTIIDPVQAAAHPETAQTVTRIKALRQTIGSIDSAVVALLAEQFKATSQVSVLETNAGFAPGGTKCEDCQVEHLHRITIDVGLNPEIAEMYREFVIAGAEKRYQRIADAGGDPGVLDVFA